MQQRWALLHLGSAIYDIASDPRHCQPDRVGLNYWSRWAGFVEAFLSHHAGRESDDPDPVGAASGFLDLQGAMHLRPLCSLMAEPVVNVVTAFLSGSYDCKAHLASHQHA